MRICAWRSFEGPNVHCHRPVLECLVDLEDLDEVPTSRFPDVPPRLLSLLPGLGDHHCGLGHPGGFAIRLREGTLFGHVLEHVALELVHDAGEPVRYGKTRATASRGVYRVVIEQSTPQLARAAMDEALAVVEAVRCGLALDLGGARERLSRVAAAHALGPSTRAIVEAARLRGIPVRPLGVDSFVDLGYGHRRRRLEASIGAATLAVAVDAAQDKVLTRRLLDDAGIPVAVGRLVRSAEQATAALRDLGGPVVVKPRFGQQGRGVTLGIDRDAAVQAAYRRAADGGRDGDVLCERQLDGWPVRVLVVGDRAVAAARRFPPRVVGDGVRTVAALVDAENARPERGSGHERPLTRIRLDRPEAVEALARAGLGVGSVPEAGQAVDLGFAANLSTGGTAEDVTDLLHPDNGLLAVRAARAVGLDVAGVDLVLGQPERAYHAAGGAVLEVNAAPGLRMHLHPSAGTARPVADAILDHLFGAGDGRIPIAAITGTNGKTTVTRLVAHIASLTGLVVGSTTTDGIRIGGQQIARGDDAGPRSARTVLSDPTVELAVLECARGGIRRRGLGFDRCTVGAVLNVAADHLGQDEVENLDDLAHIKALVVECVLPDGACVLNARDSRVRAMAARSPARAILFSTRRDDPYVRDHVQRGGEAIALRDGGIVCLHGRRDQPLVALRRLAFAFGGASAAMVENACAAAAIAFGLGIEADVVARGLRTFAGGPRDNPGRMNLLAVGDARVLLDYGHNAPAVAATAALARRLASGRLTGVIGVPGDRRDEDILALGETAGRVFDRVFVREDRDRRGRPAGAVAALLQEGAWRAGLSRAQAEIRLDEASAVAGALEAAAPGDLVVYFYESYGEARAALERLERQMPRRLAPAVVGPAG